MPIVSKTARASQGAGGFGIIRAQIARRISETARIGVTAGSFSNKGGHAGPPFSKTARVIRGHACPAPAIRADMAAFLNGLDGLSRNNVINTRCVTIANAPQYSIGC